MSRAVHRVLPQPPESPLRPPDSAAGYPSKHLKRVISYYQPNAYLLTFERPRTWSNGHISGYAEESGCASELTTLTTTGDELNSRLQVDATTHQGLNYGLNYSLSYAFPPSLSSPFFLTEAFPGRSAPQFHQSSTSISSASTSSNPGREPSFQLLSRLSPPLPATFPPNQVGFNGGNVQDTPSRHLLHSFPLHPPEETTDWSWLLQSDGAPIIPPSQLLPGEQSEWTNSPMRYQMYPYDTPSPETPVNPVPYNFNPDSAALLSGLVNEETSYRGRQTRVSIADPDVVDAPPLPLSSNTSKTIHFIQPNHASGITRSSILPSVAVRHSLTPGFLTEYQNPTTVIETQDSDSYSTGLLHSNGLTCTSSSPVSSADRGFNVLWLSRDSPQEDISGPQFADDSRAPYQPTLAVASHTRQHHPPSTSLNPPLSPPIVSSPSKASHQDLLERAFRPHSASPNEAHSRLLDIITRSSFIQTHEIEPTINSSEGQALLKNVWDLADRPLMAFQKSNLSIYALLLDVGSRTCLICKSPKSSLDRAIGCVRSHLDHRPFVCGGDSVGCGRCKDYARPRRFFCLPYVVDHLKGQSRKFKCPHLNCETSLRRGGMERHWNRKHSGSPFPKELFSAYGKRKKNHSHPL